MHKLGMRMDQAFVRLERMLRAYVDRGSRALSALETEDWESFDKAMRWKKAAFLHFRALDHSLEQEHPGYLQEARWQSLWQEAEASDRALAEGIELHKSKLNQQLVRVRQHKATLSKFQSGGQIPTGFLETV